MTQPQNQCRSELTLSCWPSVEEARKLAKLGYCFSMQQSESGSVVVAMYSDYNSRDLLIIRLMMPL